MNYNLIIINPIGTVSVISLGETKIKRKREKTSDKQIIVILKSQRKLRRNQYWRAPFPDSI